MNAKQQRVDRRRRHREPWAPHTASDIRSDLRAMLTAMERPPPPAVAFMPRRLFEEGVRKGFIRT